jgi:hypothetical protein
MTERDLRQELEELNIISFDCTGVATKEDIFLSLDKIKEHMSNNTDEILLEKIGNLLEKKKARRYQGVIPE